VGVPARWPLKRLRSSVPTTARPVGPTLIKDMYLGKVIGRVVSTVKDDALKGKKLLLIRRLPNGPAVVAVDAVGAGAGETVYVCRGREAAFAFKPEEVPTEAAVVAIVDNIERE
jgi:ethanolamine utilization protein EutN